MLRRTHGPAADRLQRPAPFMKKGVTTALAPARSSRATPGELAWRWGMVVAWIIVIGTLSGDTFSAENTGRYIDPVLRWLFPGITRPQIITAHTIIRKSAHFSEFFVLGCLVFWAARRGRPQRWNRIWMLKALALALVCALGDEFRQYLAHDRTASLSDSGIDFLGALVSQAFLYVRARLSG